MSGYDITSVVDMYLSRDPGTRGWAFVYDGRFIGVPYRETKYPKTLAIHTALYVFLTSLKK